MPAEARNTPVDVLADVRMEVETPEHVAIEYPLAGLGSRYCALLIDLLVVVLVVAVAVIGGMVLLWWAAKYLSVPLSFSAGMKLSFAILTVFAIQWGFFFWLEGFNDGATVGKRVMRLRAVMD